MREPVDLRLRVCIATGRWALGAGRWALGKNLPAEMDLRERSAVGARILIAAGLKLAGGSAFLGSDRSRPRLATIPPILEHSWFHSCF